MGNIRTNDLLFFVFGIDEKTDEEGKIESCIDRAYLDLCRTLRFKYNTEELSKIAADDPDGENKKSVIDGKESLKKNVKDEICKSLNLLKANRFGSDESFDEWHVETMNNIIKCCDSDLFKNDFTVGHAQKWLNMTLKYMWIMGILPEGWEEHLHVPLDDYILKVAEKTLSMKRTDYNIDKWSKLNKTEDYKKFQKDLRDKIINDPDKKYNNAIQWESVAWIAEAKKTKQITNKRKT